jgi:hypothetical protein
MAEEPSILSFNVKDTEEFLNLGSLRHCLFAVQECYLAIATSRHILIMEGAYPDKHDEDFQSIQITDFEEEYGYPLCINWINKEYVSVGFDSGFLVCFDLSASVICEKKMYDSPLVALRLKENDLWILYEKGYIVSVCPS